MKLDWGSIKSSPWFKFSFGIYYGVVLHQFFSEAFLLFGVIVRLIVMVGWCTAFYCHWVFELNIGTWLGHCPGDLGTTT